jgi:hypothetical protein
MGIGTIIEPNLSSSLMEPLPHDHDLASTTD